MNSEVLGHAFSASKVNLDEPDTSEPKNNQDNLGQ